MKRWQTRGEVQDSDEEELSLGEDIDGLDHPRKKAKVDEPENGTKQAEARAEPVSLPASEETDITAHRSGVTTIGVLDANALDTFALDTPRTAATQHVEDDDEPEWTTRADAKTYGKLQRISRHNIGKARELFPVITQAEQNEADEADEADEAALDTIYDAPPSSILPDDPVAPLGMRLQSIQPTGPTTPTNDTPLADDPISRESSPLSELSNPPDSPPPMREQPTSFITLPQDGPGLLETSDRSGQMLELDGHDLPVGLLTQGARRSLRARQEKQLHPYMYDKAQYQQQCRERGLRPVRLLEQTANETQDGSLDNAQPSSSATRSSSSSSSVGNPFSSGVALEELVGNDLQRLSGEDDLPDMDKLLQSRVITGRLKSLKRQKTAHKATLAGNGTAQRERNALEDVISVPPSPPTSSHSSVPRMAKPTQGFRLPRGLSPIPLPTPQISSELRPTYGNQNTAASDEDTTPRTSRRMTRIRSAVTIGSDSSSASEQSSKDEQHLLRKERRRIRGVLPASWLHIDRNAKPTKQPLAPSHVDRESPAIQAAPQKGVARRIKRRSTSALGTHVLEISDDDAAADSNNSTPTTTQRIALTHTDHVEPSATRDDDVDSDEMEVDTFDPMLAGASRVRGPTEHSRKRQPRINDVFKERAMPDFSEERNGLRHMRQSKATKPKQATRKMKSKPKQTNRPRKRAPQLGILDAPMDHTNAENNGPQFVRLAARQARRGPDQGRHSPSRKVIRLATLEDTEQANATLKSWRSGAISQRQPTERPPSDTTMGPARGSNTRHPQTPLTGVIDHSADLAPYSVPPKLTFDKAVSSRSNHLTPRSTNARSTEAQQPQLHTPGTKSLEAQRRRNTHGKIAPQAARYRGAQLKTQESAYMQQNRSAAFRNRMQCLTEAVTRRSSTPALGGLQIARFLQAPNPTSHAKRDTPRDHDREQPHVQEPARVASNPVTRLPHRPRKRRTQRLDVDTRQYRQPSEPIPTVVTAHQLEESPNATSAVILQGLGPSGTRYATDFDIDHLPASTYFHESTFIGSGDLASALQMGNRNLETPSGSLRIFVNGNMHEWSAWSEEVSAAMVEIPSAISSALSPLGDSQSSLGVGDVSAIVSNIDHMLRSTIKYLSKCVYFLDAVDGTACCIQLDRLIQDLMEITDDTQWWTKGFQSLRQSILQYTLVTARQSQTIGGTSSMSTEMRTKLHERTKQIASRLASRLIPGQTSNLRSAYEEQKVMATRELGIRDNDSALAGMVILHHCLHDVQSQRSTFWGVISKALEPGLSSMQASADIDATWYSIFTILPCLEFDSAGIIQRRTDVLPEMDWSLPNQLVERCLQLYPATSTIRGSSINEYIRATLRRCSHLFTQWRWWRCESLLSIVYDFFTRRGLSLLHHEDGKGSPEFLENLTCPEGPPFELESEDRSFSIFLKLLAASMRTWRKLTLVPDKKIGGIAWRIIPNHARSYRKDAEVRHADLDALRNHFDLLCTLYFASPPSHRLHIDLLRNLVDHATSHREACRISVRAWSRLASFQMATGEAMDNLEPFIEWYKDMMQTTVAQYRSARTEAEQQYAQAKESGAPGLSEEVLESTIASNQRQIAATVVDLFAAYRRALESAQNSGAARVLVTKCEPWKALDSFTPSERRLKTVYNEALDLFRAAINVQRGFQTASDNQTASEDSQDYGEFDIDSLQGFEPGPAASQGSDSRDLVELMLDAFAKLLSDTFGSDISPDDALLARLLDIWVEFAGHLVGKGLRSWSNFVSDRGSWADLRATTQHHKFTPYLLAKILEVDPEAFDALKSDLLGTWLKSIVERESALKYQHLLTTALLNVSSEEPILQNLPFSRPSMDVKYEVTSQEFRQRRLGLISSILSNMLDHYNQNMLDRPQALSELGRRYSGLFRGLMQAMKSNYQELQPTRRNETADSSVQGSYVIFVQEVVTFLQQYAIEGVCTVDRFFLDSSAFPLPADDPTYVVGRLRKHVPKLSEAKTRKQLATFLHTISERAANDQQQAYLIDQMHRAMSSSTEIGDANAPSLRHVLLTSVIPAYIEAAVSEPCAWILALPMIEASARTTADLLYDTDFNNHDSLEASTEQVAILLSGAQNSLSMLSTHPEMLRITHLLKVATLLFRMCHAVVVFANHVQRSTKQASTIMRQLRNAQKSAANIEEILLTYDDFFDCFMDDVGESRQTSPWPETYDFSVRQLQASMTNDWSVIDGRYFVKRGNASREVVANVGDYSEEREGLIEAIREFRGVIGKQHLRGKRARHTKRGGGTDAFGLDSLVI